MTALSIYIFNGFIMSSKTVPAFNIYVFGGTGDLAQRKILPALYRHDKDLIIDKLTSIISIGSKDYSQDSYKEFVKSSLINHSNCLDFQEDAWDRFSKRISYVQLDVNDKQNWYKIHPGKDEVNNIFYLATPPNLFEKIANSLKDNNFVTENSKIVIEKPIGTNFKSAKDINKSLSQGFTENQIYRIDHYLGKEAVQNLLALRFGNIIFEKSWSNSAIDNIQITVAESLGMETRGEYYDQTGALKDMMQNHLLQILCLVAMEPPTNIQGESVRDEKLKVLCSLAPVDRNTIKNDVVRAQYVSGAIKEDPVKGFHQEEGIAVESLTETFVALKIFINNWRWAGVPFYLRTGKRMANKFSEVVVTFKSIPHNIFSKQNSLTNNQLVIRLQPDEGIDLKLMTKKPSAEGFNLIELPLDLKLQEYNQDSSYNAYERLLLDVLKGNTSLFMRKDEVEASWLWIDHLIQEWQEENIPLHEYIAGSWGPSASDFLLERDSRKWKNGKLKK